jgi:hypothetical protein
MKRNLFSATLALLLVFGIAVAFTSAADYSHRFTEASGNSLIADAMSPSRNGDGSNNFIRVTSKGNMARNIGSSPHVGVDMTMSAGTAVYSAFAGKVAHVNHTLTTQMGCVVMNQDIDGNGTYDNYYFVYRHIDPNDDVTVGKEYEVNESFAVIDVQRYPDGYTPHLHYGWTEDTSGLVLKSTSRFYIDEGTYWYGRDFDFFSRDYWVHNTLYINAYSKEGDTRQNVTEAEVYCKVGSGSWSEVPHQMVLNNSGNYQWRYDFGTLTGASTGIAILYYIVGYRNVTGYDNWSLWPQYYEHPPILPSEFTSGFSIQSKSKTIVDDYGNTMGTASQTSVGSHPGVISYLNDFDYFRFVPSSSRSYTIRTTGSTDTFGVLYDVDGDVITYDDDDGEGTNFSMSSTLLSGQTYYISIQHFSTNMTGAYTFWID